MKRVHARLSLALVVTLGSFLAGFPAWSDTETSFEQDCHALSSDKTKLSQHDRMWRLFDLCWKYDMTEYPEWATSVGYPGQNGRWTDISLEAIARRKRELEAPAQVLASIDRSSLNEADRLNFDLFKYRVDEDLEGRRFKGELLPVNQLEGPQIELANKVLENPTATVADYQDIISRLKGIPTVVDQTIVLLKQGVKEGITPPKITLRDVPDQIKNQTVAADKSPMLEPFKNFPSTIPVAERERLRAEAAKVIKESVVPAFNKLHDYFVTDYLPNCRQSIAWTDLPDGKAWYEYRVRRETTTHLSAAEIHEKGLSEVKRIRGEMDKLIAETGFKGSFQEFCQFLRTDPRFFYDSKENLLIGYRDIAKRIDPALMKQFGKLPRSQYGIAPVPAFSEKSQPTAYYQEGSIASGRAGLFFANTYNLKTRPKWEMEALTLHEAVPGHHLQISLAQEQENVPEFRRHAGYNAYIEGWGLYAESLGYDLGLYKDPYAHFGQLTYDMWRAIRLVVDTGMHAQGWTREQAMNLFKENTGKSEHDIEVEVDRYIVWAGQALGYKLGQLTIKDLKDTAKRELGERYDVRKFHDAVLATTAVPLDILRDQIAGWIAKEKKITAVR